MNYHKTFSFSSTLIISLIDFHLECKNCKGCDWNPNVGAPGQWSSFPTGPDSEEQCIKECRVNPECNHLSIANNGSCHMTNICTTSAAAGSNTWIRFKKLGTISCLSIFSTNLRAPCIVVCMLYSFISF